MADLVMDLVGWIFETIFESLFDVGSGRRRRRRADRRIADGHLRCAVRMVSGKIPGLTREGAAVDLELAPGSVVCRRRDDRQRAIRLTDVTLDPSSSRPVRSDDPRHPVHDDDVVWLLVTPSARLEVCASESLLRSAHRLVHPDSPSAHPVTSPDTYRSRHRA